MWQELYEELHQKNFTIIAIAFDSRDGAARPWLEQSQPGYVALIDPLHHVAQLFNMVNVNQAVWINEDGRVVRPTESAGATEGFRRMNRQTGEIPADVAGFAAQVKSRYHQGLRDWVANGDDSRYVFDETQARAHLIEPTELVQEAHATFALGQTLIAAGRHDEGNALVQQASDLHPASWAIWRQGAELLENGLAATGDFWARVDALGDKKYYAPIDMPGMPT